MFDSFPSRLKKNTVLKYPENHMTYFKEPTGHKMCVPFSFATSVQQIFAPINIQKVNSRFAQECV